MTNQNAQARTGVLSGRIALVTGASRGIGAAVARRFAAEGAHCILVARTVAGLEETDDAIRAAGGESTLAPMDLMDFETIPRMIAGLYQRFGKLDILVANAGALGVLSPVFQTDPKIWDQTLATNLTANFHLLRNCDPILRRSDAGRVILVSSGAAARPRGYWSAYAASKAGLEALAKCYADEIAQSSVRANVVDPGATRTVMRAKAYPGENPETVPDPESLGDLFVSLAAPDCQRNGEVIDAREIACREAAS